MLNILIGAVIIGMLFWSAQGISQTPKNYQFDLVRGHLEQLMRECETATPICEFPKPGFSVWKASTLPPVIGREATGIIWASGCYSGARSSESWRRDYHIGQNAKDFAQKMLPIFVSIGLAKMARHCGMCPSDDYWGSKAGKDLLKSGGGLEPTTWQRFAQRCTPPTQFSCDGLLARDPQWLDADEEEFLLDQCSADMCSAFAAGNYNPSHSVITADEMIKQCTSVLSELEGIDSRSECAQPMPVEERGIAIDEQTLSCGDLENERYQSYQRLASLYAFDQDGNNNQIDDRIEDLLASIRQTRSDLSRTIDEELIELSTAVISGGGGLSVSLYAALACLETGPAVFPCLIGVAAGAGFTTGGVVGGVAASNAGISAGELRTRLDVLDQQLSDESFSIQRSLNEALAEANMLCTRVQNECQ